MNHDHPAVSRLDDDDLQRHPNLIIPEQQGSISSLDVDTGVPIIEGQPAVPDDVLDLVLPDAMFERRPGECVPTAYYCTT
ncbi:MAG TPA: hypothetical protein VG245_05070 [Candidatus Dormibacteraeota bacterium]|jgi:hypothetical protein|nr:hypothetical protein [Candidatus Dormibacteraeota bacterium]